MKKRVLFIIVAAVTALALLASCSDVAKDPADTEKATDAATVADKPEDSGPTTDTDGGNDVSGPVDGGNEFFQITKTEDGRLALWDENVCHPVKLDYIFLGYAPSEYETEDAELIERVVAALKEVKVGEPGGMMGEDNGDRLTFTMDNGSQYTVNFNFGNLEVTRSGAFGKQTREMGDLGSYGNVYETEGFGAVRMVLKELEETGR